MVVELKVHVPPDITQVNMLSVLFHDEDIGYINHVLKQLDGDLLLCAVDVFEDKEEFVLSVMEN